MKVGEYITRINHVTFSAPYGSQDLIRRFYGGLMGLEEIKPPKILTDVYEIMWFKIANLSFYIQFSPYHMKNPDLSHHVCLEVKNIREFRELLKSKGVELEGAVEKSDQERFYMRDPVGNLFEFTEIFTKK